MILSQTIGVSVILFATLGVGGDLRVRMARRMRLFDNVFGIMPFLVQLPCLHWEEDRGLEDTEECQPHRPIQ